MGDLDDKSFEAQVSNPYMLGSSETPPQPSLPEPHPEYALVAMRFKNIELGFCMKPEQMRHDGVLAQAMEQLRRCVIENADLNAEWDDRHKDDVTIAGS